MACPFCEAKVPRPTPIEGYDEISGGRCTCGAVWIADVTGKAGGQALVDGLTILCDGDIDRAMALESGRDYDVRDLGYRPRMHTIEPKRPGRGRSFGRPKLWFLRRRSDDSRASE